MKATIFLVFGVEIYVDRRGSGVKNFHFRLATSKHRASKRVRETHSQETREEAKEDSKREY